MDRNDITAYLLGSMLICISLLILGHLLYEYKYSLPQKIQCLMSRFADFVHRVFAVVTTCLAWLIAIGAAIAGILVILFVR